MSQRSRHTLPRFVNAYNGTEFTNWYQDPGWGCFCSQQFCAIRTKANPDITPGNYYKYFRFFEEVCLFELPASAVSALEARTKAIRALSKFRVPFVT